MEVVNYRILSGSEFQWNCYGKDCYTLDSTSIDCVNSAYIAFNTITQIVMEMTVCDYNNQRAYRWINPEYEFEYEKEAKYRGVNSNQAWDDVEYIDVEPIDMLEKASAIMNGVEYDTRVTIPFDLDKEELYKLMTYAHEADMSLNMYIEKILSEKIVKILNNSPL